METIVFFATTLASIVQTLHFFSSKRRYFKVDDTSFTERVLVQLEDSLVIILEWEFHKR